MPATVVTSHVQYQPGASKVKKCKAIVKKDQGGGQEMAVMVG